MLVAVLVGPLALRVITKNICSFLDYMLWNSSASRGNDRYIIEYLHIVGDGVSV